MDLARRFKKGRGAREAEERRLAHMQMFFGHLCPDITAREATTELNALDMRGRGHSGAPAVSAPLAVEAVRTLLNPGSPRLAQTLSAVMPAIFAVVLMIACVNVGHLLLTGARRSSTT